MALRTKAFDAQDALVGLLAASGDLSAWVCEFGLPSIRPQEMHIWIDEEVNRWQQELSGTGGATTRTETFEIYVYVYRRGTDLTALEIRSEVKAAGDVIADIVTASPFLGNVVMFAEITGGTYEAQFADAEGRSREAILRLHIGCIAYLA